MSLAQRMYFLQDVFLITAIALVSVINHYHIKRLHLFWDPLYYANQTWTRFAASISYDSNQDRFVTPIYIPVFRLYSLACDVRRKQHVGYREEGKKKPLILTQMTIERSTLGILLRVRTFRVRLFGSEAEFLLGRTRCKVHRPQNDPYCCRVVSERPEKSSRKTSMTGRWNCQVIRANIEKNCNIKNVIEAYCGRRCEKYQTAGQIEKKMNE